MHAKISAFRWWIVALCLIIGIVNYLDRSSLSFFYKPIVDDFDISHAQFGLLSSAFAVGYFLMTFIGGWLADTVGSRRVLFVILLCWGILSLHFAVSAVFAGALVNRLLLGAAEGPSHPSVLRALTNWLPKSEISKGSAIGISIVSPAAIIIGGPLAAAIYSWFHRWEAMFILIGILSFIAGFAWLLLFRDDPQDSPIVKEVELDKISTSAASTTGSVKREASNIKVIHLLRDGTLCSNFILFFTGGYLFWFTLSWFPGYLQDAYNVHVESSALFSTIPWFGFGVAAIVSSVISDHLLKSTGSLKFKKHALWIVAVASGLFLIPPYLAHNLTTSIAFISLAVTALGFANSLNWSLNADVVPERAGLAGGIMDAAYALAGFVAPFFTGWLVDTTGSFSLALLTGAVIAIIGGILVTILSHPDRSVREFRSLADRTAGRSL
jgi:sugar phosphate permease